MSKKVDKSIKKYGLNKYFNKFTDKQLIGVYDTSYGTLNVGDEIINQASRKVLSELFPVHQFITASTHDSTSSFGIYNFNNCFSRFVCGSNILNRKMISFSQWNIGLLDILRMNDVITLGVGWGKYDDKKIPYSTKWFYHYLFSKDYFHSVRDNYTKEKLNSIGVTNVINTGCPTMWDLTPEHCSKIPTEKSKNVVVTLTDYRQDIDSDRFLLKTLSNNYNTVHLWLQGSKDLAYVQSLDIAHSNIVLVPAQLRAYEELLMNNDLDFVGTRLHAGIKALQHKKRTIIIGVDNRANEKKKDFNLTVLDRSEIKQSLEKLINSSFITEVSIDIDSIEKWKSQFNDQTKSSLSLSK